MTAVKGFSEISYNELMDVNGGDSVDIVTHNGGVGVRYTWDNGNYVEVGINGSGPYISGHFCY